MACVHSIYLAGHSELPAARTHSIYLAGHSELQNNLLFYTCVAFNANFRVKLPVATDKIVSLNYDATG